MEVAAKIAVEYAILTSVDCKRTAWIDLTREVHEELLRQCDTWSVTKHGGLDTVTYRGKAWEVIATRGAVDVVKFTLPIR